MSLRFAPLFSLLLIVASIELNAQPLFDIEVVDANGAPGISASLALGSQGNPHIAYIEAENRDLKYAVKIDSVWEVEWVNRSAGLSEVSLVLDLNDAPGISEIGRFWRKNNDTWSHEDMGGFAPWYSTAAADDGGTAHGVTIWSWGSGLYQGFVWYVKRVGDDEWASDPFADAPFIPIEPHASLVLGPYRHPHIALIPTNGADIEYWHSEGLSWTKDSLMPGTGPSIAVDNEDNPRISFYDPINADLMLAIKQEDEWITTPLVQVGDVGVNSSHVIRNGDSHIVYYDATNGDLMYVVVGPLGRHDYTVDSQGDVGRYCSLVLDEQGKPHIAYRDATNQALKYAIGTALRTVEKQTLGRIKWKFRQ